MIELFVNPRAGRMARRANLHDRLAARLGGDGRVHAHATLEELAATMRRLVSAGGLDVIAICGGDGTLRAVVSALVAAAKTQTGPSTTLPALLLLPAGTINTTAKNLRIPRQPLALLDALLAARHRNGEVPEVGHTMLEVVTPAAPLQVGSIFGAAMVGRFFEMYTKLPHRGPITVARLGVHIAASALAGGGLSQALFAPTLGRLTIDGIARPEAAYTLLLASTLVDAGLHLRPTYRGAQAGAFHLVASQLPPERLARQIPRVLAGKPLVGTPHLDTLARQATFAFAGPEPCMLDGDMFIATRVDVSPAPPLRFLKPFGV